MTLNCVKNKRTIALLLCAALIATLLAVVPVTINATEWYMDEVCDPDSLKASITDLNGNPLQMPMDRHQQFKFSFSYEILNGMIKSEDDVLIYELPLGVDIVDTGKGYITHRQTGNVIGEYEIGDGVVYFWFYKSFLDENSNIQGDFNCKVQINEEISENVDSGSFEFPGMAEPFEYRFFDTLGGSKSYSIDPETGDVIFYISFTPDANYKNVTIKDILGDNLRFSDDAKFEMKSGWANWGDATLNPNDVLELQYTLSDDNRTADVFLGDVKAHTRYEIRYRVHLDDVLSSTGNTNMVRWFIKGE